MVLRNVSRYVQNNVALDSESRHINRLTLFTASWGKLCNLSPVFFLFVFRKELLFLHYLLIACFSMTAMFMSKAQFLNLNVCDKDVTKYDTFLKTSSQLAVVEIISTAQLNRYIVSPIKFMKETHAFSEMSFKNITEIKSLQNNIT